LTVQSFALLIAPVVTITSTTRSSNKIQNGDILVPTNPGPREKWPLKMERQLSLMQVTEHMLGSSDMGTVRFATGSQLVLRVGVP